MAAGMIISQYDHQMYLDEIAELREEMTQLLISMELYHQTHSQEEFDRWWDGEGNQKRYFACEGRIEQIQNFLAIAQVVEEEHPKMRRGGIPQSHYGAGEDDR
jgi:hypothetical protein